jgi:hypothetical protein
MSNIARHRDSVSLFIQMKDFLCKHKSSSGAGISQLYYFVYAVSAATAVPRLPDLYSRLVALSIQDDIGLPKVRKVELRISYKK